MRVVDLTRRLSATPEVREPWRPGFLAEERARGLPCFRGSGGGAAGSESDILRFYGEEKEVSAPRQRRDVYTVRQRLYELEQRLAAQQFVRISHSEIVNLRQVTGLDLSLYGHHPHDAGRTGLCAGPPAGM